MFDTKWFWPVLPLNSDLVVDREDLVSRLEFYSKKKEYGFGFFEIDKPRIPGVIELFSDYNVAVFRFNIYLPDTLFEKQRSMIAEIPSYIMGEELEVVSGFGLMPQWKGIRNYGLTWDFVKDVYSSIKLYRI